MKAALYIGLAAALLVPLSIARSETIPDKVQQQCATLQGTATLYSAEQNTYRCSYNSCYQDACAPGAVYLNPDGTQATLPNGATAESQGVQLDQGGTPVPQQRPQTVSVQAPPTQTPQFQALAPVSGSSVLGNLYNTSGSPDGSLANYLNALFRFAIAIGALAAVLMFTFAGYQYMFNDKLSSKMKAKDIFSNVFLGMVVLLGCWLILYQINPCLLNLSALKGIEGQAFCS